MHASYHEHVATDNSSQNINEPKFAVSRQISFFKIWLLKERVRCIFVLENGYFAVQITIAKAFAYLSYLKRATSLLAGEQTTGHHWSK